MRCKGRGLQLGEKVASKIILYQLNHLGVKCV